MKINFIHDIIKCLIGADLGETESNSLSLLRFLNKQCNELLFPLYKNPKEFSRFCNLDENTIYELHVYYGVYFVAFKVKNTNYVIGPIFLERFSEYQIVKKLKQMNFPDRLVNQIVSFSSFIPTINVSKVNHLAMLLHHEISGIDTRLSHKIFNFFEGNTPKVEINQYKFNTSNIRKIEARYEISHALEEAVKQGNFSMAMNFLSQYNYSKDFDVRNESPLRNLKNYCIVLNTQLRLALEQIGIHPYQLDKISNKIGLKIEKVESFQTATQLVTDIIKEYCNLAQRDKYSDLKPLIRLTIEYIKEHLSDNVSVKETAKTLGVNADYLSYVFHNEMKMSFIEFVNSERIKQAAELLKYSTLQIQEIALMVGYNSTSYFSKQFQKIYGVSPKLYRNNII